MWMKVNRQQQIQFRSLPRAIKYNTLTIVVNWDKNGISGFGTGFQMWELRTSAGQVCRWLGLMFNRIVIGSLQRRWPEMDFSCNDSIWRESRGAINNCRGRTISRKDMFVVNVGQSYSLAGKSSMLWFTNSDSRKNFSALCNVWRLFCSRQQVWAKGELSPSLAGFPDTSYQFWANYFSRSTPVCCGWENFSNFPAKRHFRLLTGELRAMLLCLA